MPKVIFEFETEELKDEFMGWMSDGGGEQEFNMLEHLANFEYIGQNIVKITKP